MGTFSLHQKIYFGKLPVELAILKWQLLVPFERGKITRFRGRERR